MKHITFEQREVFVVDYPDFDKRVLEIHEGGDIYAVPLSKADAEQLGRRLMGDFREADAAGT